MFKETPRLKTKSFRKWLKRKHKRADRFDLSDLSDGDEDETDDYNLPVSSSDAGPSISTNELRIFVGTWNVAGRSPVGSLAVDLDEWLNLKEAADIYVLGFQEIVPLKTRTVIGAEDPTEATNWNLLIGKTLNDKYGCPWLTPSDNYHYVQNLNSKTRFSTSSDTERQDGHDKYKMLASKKMVGVFISVWMKNELLRKYCISNVKVSCVACGIMGYLGNKGSVSVSISIEGTSFCFVAAHLASGEKKGDEGRRNHQVSEIFRRTTFPRSSKDEDTHHPLTILGHDRIFWFGDLNYRLYLQDDLARQLVRKQDWEALTEFDQLRRELEDGGVFQGWREENIGFAPTYKYSSSNVNRYSGGLPRRSGEKQRTPAWCDRIIWYGKGVKQLSYLRSESKFSDHRPVSALFSTQIEVDKSPTSRILALQSGLPNITSLNQIGQNDDDSRSKSTLLSLIRKDKNASPTHYAENVEHTYCKSS